METENISSGSGMHGMHHRRNVQMLLNPNKRRNSIAPGEAVKTGGLIAMVMNGHGRKHKNIMETFENKNKMKHQVNVKVKAQKVLKNIKRNQNLWQIFPQNLF